ncbi:hypothetical protein BDV93DRAFT_559950 [Ceratobasidium sp. AG-I]|nr:hypothetical protein BDV93DRAFT_559950 [Ceratobasidium sp. AG-I]
MIRRMLTVTKGNFARLLHQARQEVYTTKNRLSAFQATGICPFDVYRTVVMREFRDRARNGSMDIPDAPGIRASGTRITRSQLTKTIRQVAEDSSASPEALRDALHTALAVIEGADAQTVLLESELTRARETIRQKPARGSRGGRVGRARVYTQEEVEEVRKTEEARAQGSSRRGRGRGVRTKQANVASSE